MRCSLALLGWLATPVLVLAQAGMAELFPNLPWLGEDDGAAPSGSPLSRTSAGAFSK